MPWTPNEFDSFTKGLFQMACIAIIAIAAKIV